MTKISDLIYDYETLTVDELSKRYYREDLSKRDLVGITRYFVNNMRPHHVVPGGEWLKLCGIVDYWDQHRDISDRQAIYAISTVKDRIGEVEQHDLF